VPSALGTSHAHVLVIDATLPDATRDAGSASMIGFMRLLRDDGHDVTFLAHDERVPPGRAAMLKDLGVDVDDAGLGILRWLVAQGRGVDRIIVARPDIAQRHLHRLRRWTPGRIIYYTHDLHFLRERRRGEITGDRDAAALSRRFLEVEILVFGGVDTVLTPSSAEKPLIEALVRGRDVRVLVPFVEVPTTDTDEELDMAGRRDLLFVGGFTHDPNVDAAEVLVREVMPHVWIARPDTTVVIVGQDPPDRIQRLADDRVKVTGHVPELGPHWRRARAMVAPIRYGAGVKGKLLSSLAAGVPVVTTPIGNEGIDLVDGVHGLIADTPELLAAGVTRLLSDDEEASRLAREGRRFVRDRFSESVTRAQLRAALEL
jgi:glycosyltransferase involved in cell wall biosynthesis